MVLNYLKVAWRHLVKHKTFSFINIGGLALGMAVSMQIMLFVMHEFSYDQFHENSERIYRMKGEFKFGEQTFRTASMSAGFGPVTKESIPGVENFVRISPQQTTSIRSDEDHIFEEDRFLVADPTILDVFSFSLISGDPKKVLEAPQQVIITPETGQKYFGDKNPIGQTLYFQGKLPFTITGLVHPAPSNSTLQYDFIASLSSQSAIERLADPDLTEEQLTLNNNRMQLGSYTTFLLLSSGTQASSVAQKIKELAESPTGGESEFILDPMADLHFKSNFGDASNVKNVYLFLGVAFLVLALALINYISLTTARSLQRAKEVGVRKVTGARRSDLIYQFFSESALITVLAFGAGLLLFRFGQPFFYQLLDLSIDPSFSLHPMIFSVFGGLLIICILISGSIPALGLSAYQPVKVLQGKLSSGKGGNRLRELLTIFQFGATIVLIIGAVVVSQQLRYVMQTSAGMAQDQIVSLPFSKDAQSSFQAYRSAIMETTDAQDLTSASTRIFKNGISTYFIKSPINQKEIPLNVVNVDDRFLDFFNLKWEKPPLDKNRFGDNNTIILNKKAMLELGMSRDSVYTSLDIIGSQMQVIGVLKDFHYQSLHNSIRPLAIRITPSESSAMAARDGAFYLKFNTADRLNQELNKLREIQRDFDPDQAFNYSFLDDTFTEFYTSERRMTTMLKAFTGLAGFISCLGLFGLMTYNTERRTKEIGIRKVLGASISSIVTLLSKDFIRLVIISFVVAAPLAWYLIQKWLQNFAYRIEIQWWVFLLTGGVAIFIAFVTISWQSFQAAVANPVKALKNE